ncbi:alpha/beta hydrolase [Luteimonas sp. SX5]|uniref:Alpha/beta hydrolase n=1 Tax=Luteimonas galliterrae TaxID=2940486 RepID=A0ABT0MJF7_9GAMM|nr:alpha/beta hydrolase [Luteimonas galliterrae]MCL1634808.1 alpha/beta hydrolase [Luteimonas galliterrae]
MTEKKLTNVASGPVELGVRIAGDSGNPALVLLHGWPHSGALYDGVIDRLAAENFVLAFDLPAIGASHGAPPSAEKTVLADVVLSAAEALGAESIVIAGIDVGGMIAFAAARDHADRIAGAAVMNTVIPGVEPWSKVIADPRIWHFAFHAVPELPETMVAGRERPYFDFFIDFLAGDKKKITGPMRAAFVAAYARPEALKAGFDWYRTFELDAKRNAVPKTIETPMLYVRGDADGRRIAEYLQGLSHIGVTKLEHETIPGGEFSPLEAPDAFVTMLHRFCARCQPKPR